MVHDLVTGTKTIDRANIHVSVETPFLGGSVAEVVNLMRITDAHSVSSNMLEVVYQGDDWRFMEGIEVAEIDKKPAKPMYEPS